jgi:probable HAF family extracellular repeat protein
VSFDGRPPTWSDEGGHETQEADIKLRIARIALSLALGVGVASLVAATPASAAATRYTMSDLGNLGYGASLGFGINAGGEVVGRSYLNNVFTFRCGRHTCRFTQNDPFSWNAGTMTDLGTFNARAMSEATAVNRTGDVVGGSNGRAFLVHNGQMSDQGLGEATGINDFGEIVGSSQGAFLISGGTRTALPALSSYGGGSFSSACGINNSHQIAGSSDSAAGYSHAVLWSNGKITDLGTLGGTQSAAYAINDNGQVVGWAHTASEATHVFLWSNGTMTDLGTFGLDPVGEAINNHGVIVGQSGDGAWVWSGGAFQNLNNLIPSGSGFTLNDATAINDNGQIVANGSNSTGQQHAFLLTPAG